MSHAVSPTSARLEKKVTNCCESNGDVQVLEQFQNQRDIPAFHQSHLFSRLNSPFTPGPSKFEVSRNTRCRPGIIQIGTNLDGPILDAGRRRPGTEPSRAIEDHPEELCVSSKH